MAKGVGAGRRKKAELVISQGRENKEKLKSQTTLTVTLKHDIKVKVIVCP
jgi:hypothetical protein